MEGLKHTFNCQIDDHGTLRMDMVELRALTGKYRNKKVVMSLEILDGGDTVMMLTLYWKHIIPKAIAGFRELGNNYTAAKCDEQLRCLTTTCHMEWDNEIMIVPVEQLDRELLKKYTDEITLFCAEHLSISL